VYLPDGDSDAHGFVFEMQIPGGVAMSLPRAPRLPLSRWCARKECLHK
jgi:hypothetical protein